MGFSKAFGFAKLDALTLSISKFIGLIWLLAACLFIACAILFIINLEFWWFFGGLGILLSQFLIILDWSDAKNGTIANVIILIPVIISLAGSLPSSYKNIFKAEAIIGLNRYTQQPILTEQDLAHLPIQVQKYIIYCGALRKEKIHNFKAVFVGGIKPKPNSDFLEFKSIQYNFYDEPTRDF
ncbi:MAG: hypothetical protein FJ214_06435 [Ignavibacteria bacterium]|nr:hypothetical protein [Ignavibacteria bacterium]